MIYRPFSNEFKSVWRMPFLIRLIRWCRCEALALFCILLVDKLDGYTTNNDLLKKS